MALNFRLGVTPTDLPPLPVFQSDKIRTQVFTHRSYFGRPNRIFEDHPDDPAPDNEKLEHLGDTVLGLIVTTLMTEMYPCLRVGPSTKIRALIVGNATLAEIARRYKLPTQLRLHPAQAITLKASPNVQADVFESFIGGLYLDQGLEAVQTWLNVLLRPYAEAAYRIVRVQHGLPPDSPPSPSPSRSSSDSVSDLAEADSASAVPSSSPGPRSPYGPVNAEMTMTTIGHLALFNQHVQKTNRIVEWRYNPEDTELDPRAQGSTQLITSEMVKGLKTTPVWFVKVIVDDECLGQGRGATKKLARNEAAKEGLQSLGIQV